MDIPKVCRYCGGKIVKTHSNVLYRKGKEPIYLCTMCNAYVGCYKGTDQPAYPKGIDIIHHCSPSNIFVFADSISLSGKNM